VTRHPGIVRVVSWNLFHGRDDPPDPSLHTWRSRAFRVTEVGAEYAQVNRPLLPEFAEVLGRAEGDVLFLQEQPPRWVRPLAERIGASAGASVLTSRNFGHALRSLLADLNPDLIASGDGGSNGVLLRSPWRIAEVQRLTLTEVPERRRMIWARITSPQGELCVANLHATAGDDVRAAADVALAAEQATSWSRGLPLVLGGDLNLRPARTPEVFAALESVHELAGPTAPRRIDHLLARGLERDGPTKACSTAWREVHDRDTGKLLRLSDHDAVAAAFTLPASR
jgi:endonuclease/exonuclease/phosphatase family metal-dependent hydrolase